MKFTSRIFVSSVLTVGLGFGLNAQACQTSNWDDESNIGTNAVAGSPPAIPRLSEFCALEVTDVAYVQSNKASNTKYIVRFYVFNGLEGSGDVDIFEAYSNNDGTGPLFKVSLDGSQFTFDATAAGGGTETVAADAGKWNLVEVEWDSVGGMSKAWVNRDAVTENENVVFAAGAGTVESVKLGAPNDMPGTQSGRLLFDTFESHRQEPVGMVLIGDANADDRVSVVDYTSVQTEILGTLAPGQPDCTLDGRVSVADYSCIQGVILSQ